MKHLMVEIYNAKINADFFLDRKKNLYLHYVKLKQQSAFFKSDLHLSSMQTKRR